MHDRVPLGQTRGHRLGPWGRTLLVVLSLYALGQIVPDFWRILRPLGSFGLSVDDNGTVYDTRQPFDDEAASPAWRAGIRVGDRLDLARMRCFPPGTDTCATMLALWGGFYYVLPGRVGTLHMAAGAGQADPEVTQRDITVIAEQRPQSQLHRLVLLLDQLAGVLVVLGGAWLVWLRPGGMTWGFFAYVIEFNPGQASQFYAWLQQWPVALLAQWIAACALQAAAYTGFLLFALRVPVDQAAGAWRRLERALPALAVLFFLLALASLGSLFGWRAEAATLTALIVGLAVDAAALAILIGRRNGLGARDYQRIRWVIWGCVIGLPAYLLAEIAQATSLPASLFGAPIPEDVLGLIYLVNGVLCLFVVEAVRRDSVVNVTIPLRRATVLGLLLSVPAFFLREEIGVAHEFLDLRGWPWLVVASILAFLIARLHELATALADGLFDVRHRRAETHLEAVALAIQRAESVAEIERLLVDEPLHTLRLASAAVFREEAGSFRRHIGAGWDAASAEVLDATALLHRAQHGGPACRIEARDLADARLPDRLRRPQAAVAVGNPRRFYAIALYGGHESGTDLNQRERDLLARLARQAEIAYAFVEAETLRRRIAALESRPAQLAGAGDGRQ
jgi:hypothetical protein